MDNESVSEMRLADIMLAWRKRWVTRLLIGLVVACMFAQVLDLAVIAGWTCVHVVLQLASVILVTPRRMVRAQQAGRVALLSLPPVFLHALCLSSLSLLALQSGEPIAILLAYGLAIGGLMSIIVSSNGSARMLAAAITPAAVGLCLGYPWLLHVHGMGWNSALIASITGVLAILMAVLTHRRFANLIAAEVRARRQAEAATDAKSKFVATVSHELRTPISAIQAGASALAQGATRPSERAQADLILEAGRMMRALLDDLLDMAKLEAGRLSVTAAPFSPRGVLASAAVFWRAEARKRGVSLRLAGAREIPAAAIGDAIRMRQILNNLISNALKFTDHGSVTLHLSYGNDSLVVEVRDSGCGMSAEQLERLFRPFSQADDSVAATHGGTGLGLAISQDLARAMGGDITVVSEVDVGSSFTLRLPMPATASGHAPLEQEATPVVLEGLRVLAVDDHEINRRVLGLLLEPLGIDLTLASDGTAALELLKTGTFDLLMVDVHMPGLSGYDVARSLRAGGGANATIPIIAVTGAVSEDDAGERAAAGIDLIVAKPIEPAQVMATLAGVAKFRNAPATTPIAPPETTFGGTRRTG